MKSKLKKALSFLTIFTMVFVYSSCNDDDPVGPGPPPGSNNPPTNSNVIDSDINSRRVLENRKSGVDYEICGRISINAELIIEPGTEIVMCSGARVYVKKDGSFNAVGTETSPIVIRGKTATAGYWDVIDFSANNPDNVLEHVIISDGGGLNSYQNASVYVNKTNNSQLTIKNSQINGSKGYGLVVENGASIPNFSNNTFTDNGDAPVKLSFSIIGALDDSSNYADGNANNYIDVAAATLNQAQEVKNINVPYLLSGRSHIKENLKLNPGVKWLMASGTRVYTDASGSFNAVGTTNDHISIKGKVNSVGYWEMIDIESNNPLNEFKHVDIQNGGGLSTYQYASIYVNNSNNASFIMNDCSISDSYGWGIYVRKGASMTPSSESAVKSANTFDNNGSGGNANCSGDCDVHFQQ